MTIAAHIVFSKKNDHNYLPDNLVLLAKRSPADHFVFFSDTVISADCLQASNITPVLIKPVIKNNISLYYWYNFKLPDLLRRYDAHAFISESGAISLRATTAQFLFFKESYFSSQDKHPHKRFLLKYFPRFAEKAAAIFTTEKYIAAAIKKKFPQAAEKILIPYHGLDSGFQPFSWEQKEKITTAYSSGNDYFIFYVSAASRPNIKMALKAFSIFKKWQKSSMKMILLAEGIPPGDLAAELNLYKYREEVLTFEAEAATTPSLVASALALLYLPVSICGENIGLNALQCQVPLITLSGEDARLSFGEAALYTEANETAVAEKMLLLYKDESLRKTLSTEGLRLLLNYSLEKSAAEMMGMMRLKSGL